MVFQQNQTTHPHDGGRAGEQRPTLAPRAAAARVPLGGAVDRRADAGRLAAGIGKFHALLGVPGSVTLVAGTLLAVACTAWALTLDVPRQVAYLAGYITLAATACICAALVAVRHSTPRAAVRPAAAKAAPRSVAKPAAKPDPIIKHAEPDYAAWTRAGALRVADAARLWCGIEPGHPVNAEVIAWAGAILEAIERGELPKSESTGVLAQYKIGWHTEVRRDALKAWAEKKGHAPRFLRD